MHPIREWKTPLGPHSISGQDNADEPESTGRPNFNGPPLIGLSSIVGIIPTPTSSPLQGVTSSASLVETTKTHESSEITSTSVPPAAVVSAESSSSGNNGGNSLSNGAVAGVAIAALIVGAILAFAAAFFLFRRRSKPRSNTVGYNNPYDDSTPELVMMQKAGARSNSYVQISQTPIPGPIHPGVPVPAPQPNSSDIIASILPAAAHETEIQSRLAALFQQIHRHVETYYRDVHASITPSMEPELARFGSKEVNMADLLQHCPSATTAIKHALTAYILGITSPQTSPDGETLFPQDLNAAKSHKSLPSDPKTSIATSLHRRLSVLLYTTASTTQHTPCPTRTSRTRSAAEHFSLTFFPWATPQADDIEREDDLTRIIGEALEVRIWLHGQPSEYVFGWGGVGGRGVVVRPEVRRLEIDGEGGGRVVGEIGVVGM